MGGVRVSIGVSAYQLGGVHLPLPLDYIDIQSTNKVIRMKQRFYRQVRRAYGDALDGILLSMNGDVVL